MHIQAILKILACTLTGSAVLGASGASVIPGRGHFNILDRPNDHWLRITGLRRLAPFINKAGADTDHTHSLGKRKHTGRPSKYSFMQTSSVLNRFS